MYLILTLLYFQLTLIVSATVDDHPYCALRYRRLCQGKGRHVACQFPDPEPGVGCENYTQITFTDELRHFIIHYINRRRQRIAAGNERVRGGARLPRPEIMMLVTWDRELAYLAQRLADQCNFVHDDCRATVRYPYAGQSVGEVRWRKSSGSEEQTAMRATRRVLDAWWGERRRVRPHQLTTPFRLTTKGTVWGHFSQLAVWTLRAVGCGAARHGYDHARLLLVCDFSHTNMLGQRTITPGPLAPCPIHTARRSRSAYPLLCAPVRRRQPQDSEAQEAIGYEEYEAGDDHDEDEDTKGDIITDAHVRATARLKTTKRLTIAKHSKNTNDLPIAVVKSGDWKSTRKIIDQFEHDFDTIVEQPVTLKKYHQWESRRPHIGRLREDPKSDEEWIKQGPTQKKLVTYEEDEAKHVYQERHTTRLEAETNYGLNLRHRWKQTRARPQRPGANALLNKAPEKIIRRSSLSSLMLDRDDEVQLFRDTGFNVNWRKQSMQ